MLNLVILLSFSYLEKDVIWLQRHSHFKKLTAVHRITTPHSEFIFTKTCHYLSAFIIFLLTLPFHSIHYQIQMHQDQHHQLLYDNSSHSPPLSHALSQDYSSNQQESDCEVRMEELQDSVVRVRQMVAELEEERVLSVPACVQQYCQRLSRFKVSKRQQILQIAERRASKMIKNQKVKKNWNVEDVILLVWLISKRIQAQNYHHFSQMSTQDWHFISTMISATSWQKCKFKWLSLKKVKLLNHKWSHHESTLLAEILLTNPHFHWNLVAEQLYETNQSDSKVFRTPKQCRQHWNCFINPNIQKGPWNYQQDRKLIEYVLELQGLKKWSQISKYMEGRTQNALKNRYNLLLKKQRKISGNLTEKRLIKLCLSRLIMEQQLLQRQNSELVEHEELPSQLLPKGNEAISTNSSKAELNKMPIVPTIAEPIAYLPNQVSFNLSYTGFANHFGSDHNNFLFSTPLTDNNGYYIGLFYQGN